MTEFSGSKAASGVGKLEWPQEVGSLLEVGSDGEDLVNQVLHTDNAVLAQVGLDDRVVGESNALLVDLSVSTLVDELTNRLQVGVSVGNPWLDNLQHLEGGLGHADKDTVVNLEESEELEDLSGLWCDLVDTALLLAQDQTRRLDVSLPLDTDNEDQFLLSGDVERTILLGQTLKADLLTLLVTVLFHVLLRTLEDDAALLLLGL